MSIIKQFEELAHEHCKLLLELKKGAERIAETIDEDDEEQVAILKAGVKKYAKIMEDFKKNTYGNRP